MKERYQVPTVETAWLTGLVAPPVEVNVTDIMIEEIRIQQMLDGQGVTSETAEEFLERYRTAREVVQSTPVPDDFDIEAALQASYDEILAVGDAAQML